MSLRHLRVSVVAAVAILILQVACGSSSTGDASCDSMCSNVADCGGTSCLAYCINIRTSCEEKGQSSAFNSWASCTSVLTCIGDSFSSPTCPVETVGIIACESTSSH